MAFVDRWIMTITVRDGVQRDSAISFYVPAAKAQAWIAAADRTTTDLYTLEQATLGITAAYHVSTQVSKLELQDSVGDPADNILRGNRLIISLAANARNYTLTVPARDILAYTQKQDSVECVLENEDALETFVTAFETHATTINGGTPTVRKVAVAD